MTYDYNIKQDEKIIRGSFILKGSNVVKDDTTLRIEFLLTNQLIKKGNDNSGWLTLYQDPNDNRLWELSFPDSGYFGGGPPMLTNISEDEAKQKYKQI